MAGETTNFSIGGNNPNLLSTGGGIATDTGSKGSIWQTLLSTTLPAFFQFGGATLANARNARAQENIAQNQAQWYNPMSWGNQYQVPGTTSALPWGWIIAILVILVVVYFIFKALKK